MSNSTDNLDTPVALQELLNSASLDGDFLGLFTTGMSFVVFLATMYIFISAKRDKNLYILVTLVLLNGIPLTAVGLAWQFALQAFINNGEMRYSTFLFNESGNQGNALAQVVLLYAGYLLADGLMLWRCFHMVQGSIRTMWLLYGCYVLEIATFVATIIINHIVLIEQGTNSLQLANALNALEACAAGMTAVTSFLASYTICRVILASTGTEYGMPTRHWFKHILHITISSAVLYTGFSILYTALVIGSLFSSNQTLFLAAITVSSASPAVTALAPTLMVAQITLSSQKIQDRTAAVDTHHVTTLQFQGNITSTQSSNVSREILAPNVPSQRDTIACTEKDVV